MALGGKGGQIWGREVFPYSRVPLRDLFMELARRCRWGGVALEKGKERNLANLL